MEESHAISSLFYDNSFPWQWHEILSIKFIFIDVITILWMAFWSVYIVGSELTSMTIKFRPTMTFHFVSYGECSLGFSSGREDSFRGREKRRKKWEIECGYIACRKEIYTHKEQLIFMKINTRQLSKFLAGWAHKTKEGSMINWCSCHEIPFPLS